MENSHFRTNSDHLSSSEITKATFAKISLCSFGSFFHRLATVHLQRAFTRFCGINPGYFTTIDSGKFNHMYQELIT